MAEKRAKERSGREREREGRKDRKRELENELWRESKWGRRMDMLESRHGRDEG